MSQPIKHETAAVETPHSSPPIQETIEDIEQDIVLTIQRGRVVTFRATLVKTPRRSRSLALSEADLAAVIPERDDG